MSFLGTTTLLEEPQHFAPRHQLNGKATARHFQHNPDLEDEEADDEELVEFGQRSSHHQPLLNEWRFTLILLLFSLTVIVAKLFLNHDFFAFLDVDNKVNGSIPYYNELVDKTILPSFHKYTWLLKAMFMGLATTGITWFILYEDSHIPGVNPPSPFSPSKKRIYPESSTLELNYFVGGLIGFLVFLYMCL